MAVALDLPRVSPRQDRATLQQLAFARRELAGRRGSGEPLPEIILISVDPERDTPDILKAYTGHFGQGITGLSGDAAELDKLTCVQLPRVCLPVAG